MRFPSRLLLAILIAAPVAVAHAQAEPAQEAPAPDPDEQQQPAADGISGADRELEPWTQSVREAAQPVMQDIVEHYAIYLHRLVDQTDRLQAFENALLQLVINDSDPFADPAVVVQQFRARSECLLGYLRYRWHGELTRNLTESMFRSDIESHIAEHCRAAGGGPMPPLTDEAFQLMRDSFEDSIRNPDPVPWGMPAPRRG